MVTSAQLVLQDHREALELKGYRGAKGLWVQQAQQAQQELWVSLVRKDCRGCRVKLALQVLLEQRGPKG